MTLRVDHLVYASPDLAEGASTVERLLGVTPAPGGAHEGRGTRNALVGLGRGAYLEVVGVDRSQPPPAKPRWFGLDALDEPRLVTWACKERSLQAVATRARRAGVDLGAVTSGSRRRADGSLLRWRFTDPRAERLDGIVPFFVDWSGSEHPAVALGGECALIDLRAEHPHPARVRDVLRTLGVELAVAPGPAPRLIARIRAPTGVVELD